ncbi:MAG: bifunctional phosphoglucose/phosphomannose isomerase [Acidimicrobiia bacterium]|nr:bifunctional phosphoglucose/phosphomannose isomerase [Acidimicrobiia bacterium]
MRDEVAGLVAQLRWEPTGAPVQSRHDAVILCGMGGSAMAGAAAALISPIPALIHRGYGLPPAAATAPLVVGVTYSGNTDETLDALRAADGEGLPVAVVTGGGAAAEMAGERGWPLIAVPGGLQPRAAIGYQVAATARLIETASGVASAPHLEEAADLVEIALGSGAVTSLADDLATAIGSRAPVVFGAMGPAALAAQRWKTQVNENAKRPAFSMEIPEANHNDLEGWHGPDGGNGFAAVYLHDEKADPRLDRRVRLTAATLALRLGAAGEVRSQGTSPLARFFTLAVVGDLVSIALADGAGLDPTPVPALEAFKRSLDRKESP